MHNKIFTIAIVTVFVAFAIVFDTFPRSTYSELEKRELKTFPEYAFDKLKDGSYMTEISSWFSDSEPYRDKFMALSMYVKDGLGVALAGEAVKFHASDTPMGADGAGGAAQGGGRQGKMELDEYVNDVTADENAKIANAGIIVVGSGADVRALMAFGGSSKGGVSYARLANAYKKAFGGGVNVYCMVIPTAVEFYCPDMAKSCTRPQLPTIKNIYAHLDPSVKPVDVYTPLGRHAGEDIYLRTDHHWAPLGAYYAAQKFAEVAGVPFPGLSHYAKRVVRGYVGSMYGYSKDISIKKAPEDFVYYVPNGVKYTTTYVNYTIDSHYRVTGEGRPYKSAYFFHFRDGNGGAYCTFMGGDTKLTVVRTSAKSRRRVMVIKDSFGNAIPGYLFYSFGEVHVVDFRYFKKNIKEYVKNNKITDILFAGNIFNAYSGAMYRNCMRFLTQDGRIVVPADPEGDKMSNDSLQRPVQAVPGGGDEGVPPLPTDRRQTVGDQGGHQRKGIPSSHATDSVSRH